MWLTDTGIYLSIHLPQLSFNFFWNLWDLRIQEHLSIHLPQLSFDFFWDLLNVRIQEHLSIHLPQLSFDFSGTYWTYGYRYRVVKE